MPEWYFLQIGKTKPNTYKNQSRYNPNRPNMEDSIFNVITLERYFDEREKHENIYSGNSQNIRV